MVRDLLDHHYHKCTTAITITITNYNKRDIIILMINSYQLFLVRIQLSSLYNLTKDTESNCKVLIILDRVNIIKNTVIWMKIITQKCYQIDNKNNILKKEVEIKDMMINERERIYQEIVWKKMKIIINIKIIIMIMIRRC